MIPWLEGGEPFPPVERALQRPNGLLCAGGDLSPPRLLEAHRRGIFPWFSAGEPILWWSPNPRLVLLPKEMKISHSLAKTLSRGRYEVRLDTAFERVVRACAEPRPGQTGTWITLEMCEAYGRLHKLGWAHSVETWVEGELAGGLYGVVIGRVFYGESMFSRATDASKIAVAHLARFLERWGYAVIDCQITTTHLVSLGAREIRRCAFTRGLAVWTKEGVEPGKWPSEGARGLFGTGDR